jgi:hypothetical protein
MIDDFELLRQLLFADASRAAIDRIEAEVERLRFAPERVLGDEATQNAFERKLRMRLGGLTQAVGEMEPGQREFCLAAIDEWLDYMAALRAEVERLRARNDELERRQKMRIEAMLDGVDPWAEVERLRALGKAWTEAEDRWFEASDARPYDAEVAARAALARRAAADALRNALTEEVTPIQTDP